MSELRWALRYLQNQYSRATRRSAKIVTPMAMPAFDPGERPFDGEGGGVTVIVAATALDGLVVVVEDAEMVGRLEAVEEGFEIELELTIGKASNKDQCQCLSF